MATQRRKTLRNYAICMCDAIKSTSQG